MMTPIADAGAPLSLERLARKIRGTAGFRVAWQWFRADRAVASPAGAAEEILRRVLHEPASHAFLEESFEPFYEEVFSIEPPHAHSRIVSAAGDFEDLMARARAGRLGAYARSSRAASEREKRRIERLFSKPGAYRAFQLLAGEEAGCEACRDHTSHLFSSWFYGVAWDWCLILVWPEARLGWIGCLTDTD